MISSISLHASPKVSIGSKRKREEEEQVHCEGEEADSKLHASTSSSSSSSSASSDTLGPSSKKQKLRTKHPQTGGLCEDAWVTILQFLPGREVYATWTRVDKYFNELAPKIVVDFEFPRYSSLELSEIVLKIKKSPLQHIRYSPIASTDCAAKLALFQQFPLVSLTLGTRDLFFLFDESINFERVLNKGSIKNLYINESLRLTDNILKTLKSFPLTTLKILSNTSLTSEAFGHLPPTLETFHFSRSYSISSIQKLTSTPKLRILNLSSCFGLQDGLESIQSLGQLELLNLSCCKISNGLKWLCGLQIRILSLAVTPIQDKDLRVIATITRLQALSLSGCREITSKGMEHLSVLSSLTTLDVSDIPGIYDESLSHLQYQRTLKGINLSGTHVTGKGLTFLSKLVSLLFLNLESNNIDPESLMDLVDLPLRKLTLSVGLTKSLKKFKAILDPRVKPLVDILSPEAFDFPKSLSDC